MKLKFGKGNKKLSKDIWTFSLPAGRTCPGANKCKSMAVQMGNKRKIVDGPKTEFRCFAASQEVLYGNVYEARKHNLDALKAAGDSDSMAELISNSLPKRAKYVRIHVSGDFYSQEYLDAWCKVARKHPTITFYAYTKSIPFWTSASRRNIIPDNFILTASIGGKYDGVARRKRLKSAEVVFSKEEAEKKSLEVDTDDSLAIMPNKSFALLLHGVQPKGTKAAKALSRLKRA